LLNTTAAPAAHKNAVYDMKSVPSHNRKIIAHIQKSPFFKDYLMGAELIKNGDFLEYMEEVEDNPYIIKLHLDIAERLVTSGRMFRRVKSDDILDIFYEAGIPLRKEKGRPIKVCFVEKTPISCGGGGYFCCV
jgi:hypothetical protein